MNQNTKKKTTQLKQMLRSNELEFIMEAHNGLSAKIVEEAGFKGIWASGLSVSASYGVRDSNELSWTQVLETLEFMSDATQIPILVDADTGYGNFNNMRRLVRKLEQRQIAGVCIEDKLFPKTNSFISGEKQMLADPAEFCGKIKAAKDTALDPDFTVVARVESFIAGWGLEETLRRAEMYRAAGADAVLIHSKKSNPSEIEAFMKEWKNRLPVVIVPTKYYSTPSDAFREIGVSLVIWANHNLRTAITAMQNTSAQIFRDQSLVNVESKVASVSEIFRLQGDDELREAEKRYLPAAGLNANAIILAASQGVDLGEITKDTPKTLLKVHGKTILSQQVEELNKIGVKDVTVVRGFAKEKVALNNIRTVDNDRHAETKGLYSLYLARDHIRENTAVLYGDILFRSYVLNELVNDDANITLIVDADCEKSDGRGHDFVKCASPFSKRNLFQTGTFEKMSTDLAANGIDGEFIGMFMMKKEGSKVVKDALETLAKSPQFPKMWLGDLFNEIAKTHPIRVKYVRGGWLNVNTIVDLQKAGEF